MPELDIDEWLRPEDIGTEAEVLIANAGKNAEIPGEEGEAGKPTFEINIRLPDNSVKTWTMNKTSQRTLASIWGKKTEDWVGKYCILYVVDQNVRGNMKKVIYARLPQKAA